MKNDRVFPTASDRSVELKRAVKDKITFNSSNNISLVNIPEGVTTVDPLNNMARYETITEKGNEFRLKGKQTLRFCALVKMKGSKGWVEFNVKSKNGGEAKRRVNITVK